MDGLKKGRQLTVYVHRRMAVDELVSAHATSGFPGGSDGKESACNAADLGLIPGLGRFPGEGNSNPTPVFLPGKSQGQRSLAGYSPQGRKRRT